MPKEIAVLAAGVAVWLLLLLIAGLLLWNDRRSDIDEARLAGVSTTALLGAHTDSTFRAVDAVLGDLVASLERGRPARHDKPLRDLLRQRMASMPHVRAIFVIGPDGYIQHDTDFPTTADVSLADREYFQQYLRAERPWSSISSPLLSRSGQGWFVAVTQRIGKIGEFRGIAVAAVRLSYFSELHRDIGFSPGAEIALFHRDGRLMSQHPGKHGEIGENYASYPLFSQHLKESATGSYLTTSGPLPYARVVNYAALPQIPLVVVQTQNMETSLGRWRLRVLATAAVMAVLLAAILYAAAQYTRVRKAHQLQMVRNMQAEKMEAVGQLTGGIAHDFRNILGIVSMNLALIEKFEIPHKGLMGALERATRAVNNGTDLTAHLLALSRKRDMQPATCDLNEEIASVLEVLRQAAGTACAVEFEPGSLSDRCMLDRTQFEVCLINLIVNARHAVEHDGRIRIATCEMTSQELHLLAPGTGRFACVMVTDNGSGMNEEVRRRAVEPYFTTKGEHGTGFGLAQAYGMMQDLRGDLLIKSEVGVGTSIRLCFPLASPEQAEAGEAHNLAIKGLPAK